jgi:DNA-binding NtrC family response regulator/pSer/pThr/pTyr-binding forkhead associated (FHA) protein
VPFALIVHLPERTVRHRLEEGEQVVGSGRDCAVRIPHVTVSRRHARLVVVDGSVSVIDLGSTNGTTVDGWEIQTTAVLSSGTVVRFGNVKAELAPVGEGDHEAAVVLHTPSEVTPVAVPSEVEALSTVGPAVLETFALEYFPKVAAAVANESSRTAVAQSVGEALLKSLPCSRVEVVVRSASGSAGVLFSGSRGSSGETTDVSLPAGPDTEVRVAFVNPVLARTYRPIVQGAAALVEAAGPRHAVASRPTAHEAPPDPPKPGSVDPTVRDLYTQAARIAQSTVSVLILGESGTGKELFARYVHAASNRAERPLEALNCAALPSDLLEAELFGVEKGVATGVDARPGRFEAAHGGTLFLDEIGDMALETQAKILRVLQEREVYRVGGRSSRAADVRVLAATNCDLEAMLAEGRFRSDLYHRIADWVVELPPLRRRRADIPNLAAHFLTRACEGRGVRPAGISRSALEALIRFEWPGNVRQLEREMGRAALFLEDGELLDSSRLQPSILGAEPVAEPDDLKAVLEQAERTHIRRILDATGGAVADAAVRLGIGQSTLYRRMKALGITESS